MKKKTGEQDGDGQARSRFELIDFRDSKLYPPIEAALPDRAAMPLRSAKNETRILTYGTVHADWRGSLSCSFGYGT